MTIIVQVEGEYLGFASPKDNSILDMLYVHPYAAGQGVGAALADADGAAGDGTRRQGDYRRGERHGAAVLRGRGYVAGQRNLIPLEDQWLSNTTMKKKLGPAETPEASARKA